MVVQPITDMADKQPAACDYRLLAGHRRFQAIKTFLKWHCIPAMIHAGLSDREARMLNFCENLERKDLNILEEARRLAGCIRATRVCAWPPRKSSGLLGGFTPDYGS